MCEGAGAASTTGTGSGSYGGSATASTTARAFVPFVGLAAGLRLFLRHLPSSPSRRSNLGNSQVDSSSDLAAVTVLWSHPSLLAIRLSDHSGCSRSRASISAHLAFWLIPSPNRPVSRCRFWGASGLVETFGCG